MGGEFGGEWIYVICMAESLCCAPETITTLFIGYTPIQNWRFKERPGVLRFMGSQRVGHDWATELNWTECVTSVLGYYWIVVAPFINPMIHVLWLGVPWRGHSFKCLNSNFSQKTIWVNQLGVWCSCLVLSWTGSKSGKEYVKAVYCHPAYLTYMQSTSCEMLGWWSKSWESRLLGKYQ